MFEKIAIDLFYQRAVRDHLVLRCLGLGVISYGLTAMNLATWPLAFAWSALVLMAELGIRYWRGFAERRGDLPEALRATMREMMVWGAVLAGFYCLPALYVPRFGALGAAISQAISASILLVICAQHNLTRRMFYSSALVPSLAFVIAMLSLGEGQHVLPSLALVGALLVNAQSLHHANAATFRGLVESKLAADRTNERLQTALEAAEAGSRAKSTFLATMSHEIRTPLNGVLGMAEGLAGAKLDPESAEAVRVIQRSGNALLAILNDVLDLAKIEAGHLQVQMAEFDLGRSLTDVSSLFAVAAAEKQVRLSVECDDLAGRYVGDPARIRQVVSNLLSNAVKFTAAGSVTLGGRRLPGGLVEIVVQDTGIGVSPEKLATLFERFTQADGSITRSYGGTGLGLAICRELCELMGGEIEAQSQTGQGSTFVVRLPLPYVGGVQAEEPGRSAPDQLGGKIKVLAAEDNATNQLVLKTLLGQLGCDLTLAWNGQEALDLWRDGGWDVVLMDMQMPVMDGMSAIRTIRAEEAARGGLRTPIVALTADALSYQVAEQKAAGADLHLAKPIAVSALLEVLDAAVALKSAGPADDYAASASEAS